MIFIALQSDVESPHQVINKFKDIWLRAFETLGKVGGERLTCCLYGGECPGWPKVNEEILMSFVYSCRASRPETGRSCHHSEFQDLQPS